MNRSGEHDIRLVYRSVDNKCVRQVTQAREVERLINYNDDCRIQ